GALVALFTTGMTASAQAAGNVASAWGANDHGQLGQASSAGPEECDPERVACSTLPVAVSGLSGIKELAGGEQDGLALLENGTVMAWGSDSGGQLGDGAPAGTNSDVPVGVCEVGYSGPTPCPPDHYLKGVKAIAAGGEGLNVALLEENGVVVDWGQIPFSVLGDGATKQSSVPVDVCEVGYSGEVPC